MAKKSEYTIAHPSLYLRVNGSLLEQKVGDKVVLDEKQAVNMLKKGMVVEVSKSEAITPDKAPTAQGK